MKKLYSITLSLSILFTSFATSALAVTTPSFPACANPQGQTKVSYSEGTHGIVGSGATYTGKDTVYTLSDDTLTQCFCAEDGSGIQTNWWKASSLSEDEIDILKADGWVYVPAGNLWGLAEAPYVAKNTTYSCLPSSGGSSTVTTTVSEGDGIGGGEVAGDSTGSVLGLAATGNAKEIVASFALGLTLLYIGIRRLKQRA